MDPNDVCCFPRCLPACTCRPLKKAARSQLYPVRASPPHARLPHSPTCSPRRGARRLPLCPSFWPRVSPPQLTLLSTHHPSSLTSLVAAPRGLVHSWLQQVSLQCWGSEKRLSQPCPPRGCCPRCPPAAPPPLRCSRPALVAPQHHHSAATLVFPLVYRRCRVLATGEGSVRAERSRARARSAGDCCDGGDYQSVASQDGVVPWSQGPWQSTGRWA